MSATYYYSSNTAGAQTRTISVTSGKGGVGKTSLVSNMAAYLGSKGHKTLILDGDLGMGNVDIMFGLRPSGNLQAVLTGEKAISEILVEVSENVFLIPGGSGVYELARTNSIQKRILIDQINQLEGLFEYMLIDTAPGIDDNVLYLNTAAQEILVVLTGDPSSLADAYALIKVLNTRHKEDRFSVVCNMMRDEAEALRVFKRLSDVCSRFLCVSLDYKGYVPQDQLFKRATKLQQLVVHTEPRCQASFAIKHLAENLSGSSHMGAVKGGMQFFWQQLVGVA